MDYKHRIPDIFPSSALCPFNSCVCVLRPLYARLLPSPIHTVPHTFFMYTYEICFTSFAPSLPFSFSSPKTGAIYSFMHVHIIRRHTAAANPATARLKDVSRMTSVTRNV